MALSIRLTTRINVQQLIRVTLSCAIQKPCWGKCWGREPCYDNNSNDYNAIRRATGGDGGIRTLDRALQPYNGLANRRLQPLGHVSPAQCAPRHMPDAFPHCKRLAVELGRVRRTTGRLRRHQNAPARQRFCRAAQGNVDAIGARHVMHTTPRPQHQPRFVPERPDGRGCRQFARQGRAWRGLPARPAFH